jgi:MoxR-like ATPase
LNVIPGFVVIASITTNSYLQNPAISLALSNRFMTIAAEFPEFNEELRFYIARATIKRFFTY